LISNYQTKVLNIRDKVNLKEADLSPALEGKVTMIARFEGTGPIIKGNYSVILLEGIWGIQPLRLAVNPISITRGSPCPPTF
jgi:ribosome-binding protein aMBF1 (putative translation factor)